MKQSPPCLASEVAKNSEPPVLNQSSEVIGSQATESADKIQSDPQSLFEALISTLPADELKKYYSKFQVFIVFYLK